MIEVLTSVQSPGYIASLPRICKSGSHAVFPLIHIILVSWLKALTELRQLLRSRIARLWNKVFVKLPQIRSADKEFPLMPQRHSRLGSFIPLVRHLLGLWVRRSIGMKELQGLVGGNRMIRRKTWG